MGGGACKGAELEESERSDSPTLQKSRGETISRQEGVSPSLKLLSKREK